MKAAAELLGRELIELDQQLDVARIELLDSAAYGPEHFQAAIDAINTLKREASEIREALEFLTEMGEY